MQCGINAGLEKLGPVFFKISVFNLHSGHMGLLFLDFFLCSTARPVNIVWLSSFGKDG